jgi:cell division protein FtsB
VEKAVNHPDVWSRRLGSRWVCWPACLAGLALIGYAVLGPEAQRRVAIERQCAAMQAEVDAMTLTRNQLEAKQSALGNNPAFIEQVVRDELGITRPGEEWLPLPSQAEKASEKAPPPAEPAVPPFVAELARHYDPNWHFGALVAGTTLLIAAVVLSLPGRPAKTV